MAFKMKGFEPHNMYKTEKANTYKEHLALKEEGYDHSPYNKKKGLDGKACWKGYKLQGTKMKGDKRVDNCVKM
tara:strand:- start:70 stop:288 length:219 start_codon:yes stop_codon:yes gene_type:complete